MLCQLVCLDRKYQRMNCFNIREVEALLKGRFFPDLINTHDRRVVLNNTTLGLRFKTNNLDSINHNVLLFHQYGILTTNKTRPLSYLLNDTSTLNNYTFFKKLSFSQSTLSSINSFFFSTPNLLNSFLTDLHLFFIDFFSPNRSLSFVEIRGFISMLEFVKFFIIFFKSELERLLIVYAYFLDFNKPTFLAAFWFNNFKLTCLDRFLYGYMENNIGTYAYLSRT
jgi:hypothetical protein